MGGKERRTRQATKKRWEIGIKERVSSHPEAPGLNDLIRIERLLGRKLRGFRSSSSCFSVIFFELCFEAR